MYIGYNIVWGSRGGFVYMVDIDESRWSKVATRDVKVSNNFDVATGMVNYRINTNHSQYTRIIYIFPASLCNLPY